MKRVLVFLLVCGLSAWATTVSSITCAGQTATVNATAHGLVAGQGFSLTGTSPAFNSTASTVSTNSLTFVLPAGTSCSGFTSGYNSIVPAKQIININSFVTSSGNITINYVSWYTVLNPTPCSTCSSIWSGASAAEIAAIADGTTIEIQGNITFAASTPAATVSSNLVAQYNAAQASYTSGFLGYAGYWWNGASWVNH